MKMNTQKYHAGKSPLNLRTVILAMIGTTLPLIQPCAAAEFPPGCGANGSARFEHRFNFNHHQAHLGDTVPVYVTFGIAAGACQATNVNAAVYLAPGKAFDTLIDATFVPGIPVTSPRPPFEQVPYEILITPDLIGAGVSSPLGSVPGLPKMVRALHSLTGKVMTEFLDEFGTLAGDAVGIVTPGIQVQEWCAYPPGRSYFEADRPVEFTGLVTNTGDIRLTNVTISHSRTLLGFGLTDLNGFPLIQPLTLDPGQAVAFKGSYAPTSQEACAQSARCSVTVRGRDITIHDCPRASVTNTMTTRAAMSPFGPPAILSAPTSMADHSFRFNVEGRPGLQYVVEAAATPDSKTWVPIHTNTAPFTFVDPAAGLCPSQFFRVRSLGLPCNPASSIAR